MQVLKSRDSCNAKLILIKIYDIIRQMLELEVIFVTHKLSIQDSPSRPYLSLLRDGIKKAEGRVNTSSVRKMRIGDSLILFNSNRYVKGNIIFKHEYFTFEQMLDNEELFNMLPFLPANATINDGVKIYMEFPGSHRIKSFGCVAIGIEVVDYKL